jgi:hypothetical protein
MGHGRSCRQELRSECSMRSAAGRVSPATWVRALIVALVSPCIAAAAFDRTHFALVCAARSYDWTLNDRHGDKP